MQEYENDLDASPLSEDYINYNTRFKNLLHSIYNCYELLIDNNKKVPKKENKIRDILVDEYLIPKILDYEFKKEEINNLGRVDIYIIETFTNETPHFIIECKILDDKNVSGVEGLNSKYIKNGIQRFLTEHYYLKNNYNINAMIGFVVKSLDIKQNIASINLLTNQILKNLVDITQEITFEKNNIYISTYQIGNPIKNFKIYHLMMDFSKNIE